MLKFKCYSQIGLHAVALVLCLWSKNLQFSEHRLLTFLKGVQKQLLQTFVKV